MTTAAGAQGPEHDDYDGDDEMPEEGKEEVDQVKVKVVKDDHNDYDGDDYDDDGQQGRWWGCRTSM